MFRITFILLLCLETKSFSFKDVKQERFQIMAQLKELNLPLVKTL
jgi:hypothetical protein